MRLRVGVIGLGRKWRRYRSLLARLRQHVEVRAVCDQILPRAEAAAQRFGCSTAAGAVELLQRPDVEALLLLDAQWYGLWPLEQACRTNKPVLCTVSPSEDEHADAVRERMQASRTPVLMALPILLTPALRQLRELLTQRLGTPRLVRADWCAAADQAGSDLLHNSAVLSLLAGCAWLLDDVPRSVWTIDGTDASLLTVMLRFGGDRLAQVNLWTARMGRTPPCFELVADKGTARAELPRLLRWRDAEGQHAQRLPPRPVEHAALERFILTLRGGQPLWPSFEEAFQALAWLRAARQSRSEGRTIILGEP